MFLIGFFVLLIILFSIPAVQTFVANRVTGSLNAKYDISINVDRVRLKYNGNVALYDVFIKDHHQDTLIFSQTTETSLLSLRSILANNTLDLGPVSFKDSKFYIKRYKDEENDNLYVFSQKFKSENASGEIFKLNADYIKMENAHFKYSDENLDNPNVVDYRNLQLEAEDFKLIDVDVYTQIHDLQFDSGRGYNLRGLEAKFSYTSEALILDDMTLKAPESVIKGAVNLNIADEAFADFNNRVVFDFRIDEADVATNDLKTLYEEFGGSQRIKFSGLLNGTLNDFTVTDLDMQGLAASRVDGTVRFQNLLEDYASFRIAGDYTQLQTSYDDLIRLLPNILRPSLPVELKDVGVANMRGRGVVTNNSVYINADLNTSMGRLAADMQMDNTSNSRDVTYRGKIQAFGFNVGKLLKVNKLSKTSFNLEFNGSGFEQDNLNTRIRGNISSVMYNKYNYKDISVSGNFKSPVFDGRIQISDPNAKADFNGIADLSSEVNNYDFTAYIDYLDLAKLNFLSDSTAVLKGRVVMNITGKNIDDAAGRIQFDNASFKNDNELYEFTDFRVVSTFDENNIRTIEINSPDIISGEMRGNFKIGDLGSLFRNAIGSLYTNYEPEVITTDQFMEFDFNIYSKIVEVLVPQVKLEPETFIRGKVVSDDSEFKLNFRSPQIEAFGVLAQKINIQVDNKNPLFNTFVEADSIGSGFYGVSDFNLINVTLKDTLFMRSEFVGGPEKEDHYDLSFYHTINEDNQSVIGFRRSGLNFKKNQWYLNEENNNRNRIVFDNNFEEFDIEEFRLTHDNEEISLKGLIRDSTYKDIKANFNKVRLSHITPYIDSLDLRGEINGDLDLLQENGAYLPVSNLAIDSFEVNDIVLGRLDLKVEGNEDLTNYTIDTRLVNEDFESLNATGNINVTQDAPSIDMDVNLRRLNMAAFSPLGGIVLSDIRGLASGRAKVTGDYRNPSIDGELLLRNAGLKVPYLNTDYDFRGTARVELNERQFRFVPIELEDTKYNTRGTFSGTISHNAFQDWNLDLDINTDRMLVLDTEKDEFALYYGTAFISGEAQIAGPADELVIDVIATTEKGTVFNVPLDDTESFGDDSVIYFLSPEEKAARLAGKEIEINEVKGLELNFDLEVTRDALVEIVVDPINGSTLRGRGAGFLLIQINTNGKFNMFGDFTPYEGSFNFRYSGVVQKQFDILPEGSIVWDGDPEQALLDISAAYRAQANPAVLLENPSINRKIPVDVIINLDGNLIQPDITFDFNFPNASSTVTAELEYRLDDRATREYQAFSLITQNSFYTQNIDAATVATGNLIETASGIFNQILSDEDGKFTVGLDYVQADRSPDLQTSGRFGFTLSTQISNKVIINGKVGVPTGGVTESAVVGDVEISFLLNEDGTLRATIFNRQTDFQFIGEQIGYTQGAGLTYSVDFNSLKDLFQKILQGKAVRVKEEELEFVPADSEIPYEGPENYN